MIIRKLFEFESSHHVLNCSSERCSHSVHGHSYKVEIGLEARYLDNGQMVYDFGLMKSTIKEFIDSMDHCHMMWVADSKEYLQFFKDHNSRWIQLPFNPSAEMISVFIFAYIQHILDHTQMRNGEDADIHVHSVKVWETRTGSAECFKEDVKSLWNPEWMTPDRVVFSDGVIKAWKTPLKDIILFDRQIINPTPFNQV